MVFEWLRKGFEQLGKGINEKIAGFEKATGIDIPFVGTELKKEPPKPATTTAPPPPTETSKPQADLIKDLILIFAPAIVFVIVFYLSDWFFTRDAIVKGGEG